LSPSSVKLFQACQRKTQLRYYYGIEGRREPDDKLKFGTAIHKAIELNANKPVPSWSVREAAVGLDHDLSCQLAGAAAAYAVHWDGTLHYRATELRLETELRNDRLRYLTILDGLAETEGGELVVVDHKSTESDIRAGSWFWEKLQLDTQASSYIWAARANGHDVQHALWDAIKRPTFRRRDEAIPAEHYVKAGKWGKAGDLKPGTGVPAEPVAEYAKRIRDTMLAEPDVYFQRAPVIRLQDELDAAMAEVEMVGEQLLRAWDRNEWPRNPQACFSYGQRCEYWELCTGSAAPTDETLYQLRTRKEPA
jgi:hypothetical protein